MISFAETIDRCLTGPICSERDFNLKFVYQKLREKAEKFEIKFDPENPVNSDDALADRLFEAGMEFYQETGTYCSDTERRIVFSKQEIEDALNFAPVNPVFGKGKEAKMLVPRKPECDIPPFCFLGSAGGPVSTDEIFLQLVQAYAQLPLADSITTPPLTSVNGSTIRGGSPLEIMGAIRTAKLAEEAFRLAGKPGMPIMNAIATATSSAGKIAAIGSVENHHIFGEASTAEFIITFERLNEIAFLLSKGIAINAATATLLGGYAGGPATLAISNVAYHFQALLVQRGDLQVTLPMHFSQGCNSSRELLWVISASDQAISRNSNFAFFTDCYTGAGATTQMCFYEIVTEVLASVTSGAHVEIVATRQGIKPDYQTPMEPKLASEVAHACVGMSRRDANKIVKDYLELYQKHLDSPPEGVRYQDCYNIFSNRPCDSYQKMYDNFKKELRTKGLNL